MKIFLLPVPAIGACGIIAAVFGGIGMLDNDPDRWLRRELARQDGEWRVASVDLELHQYIAGQLGPLLDEVHLTDQGTLEFTNDEDPVETWERMGTWTLDDGTDFVFHWDTYDAGSRDTLGMSLQMHGTAHLLEERALVYEARVTVDEEVGSFTLDLYDTSGLGLLEGSILLVPL